MNQTVPELLRQGLIMTVLGMGLVFAALGLLWGIITLMTRLPGPKHVELAAGDGQGAEVGPTDAARAGTPAADPLTAERAQVAALMAGVLMANAMPLHLDVPIGPALEHSRTAPIWVTANRSRALRSWQPPRITEERDAASID